MSRLDLEQLNIAIKADDYFHSVDVKCRCYQLDIAFNRLYDSYYVFAGANINLANSMNENIDISNWNVEADDDKKIIQIFVRTEYLKSAMLGYKAIEDYMMQVITFALNLNKYKYVQAKKKYVDAGITIKKRTDYEAQTKYRYYKTTLELLKKELDKSKKVQLEELIDVLEKFHKEPNIHHISRQVNNLKHNNNLWFKENYIPRGISVKKYSSMNFEKDTELM